MLWTFAITRYVRIRLYWPYGNISARKYRAAYFSWSRKDCFIYRSCAVSMLTTDHFSDPGRAVGPLCVSVYLSDASFRTKWWLYDLLIWHGGSQWPDLGLDQVRRLTDPIIHIFQTIRKGWGQSHRYPAPVAYPEKGLGGGGFNPHWKMFLKIQKIKL